MLITLITQLQAIVGAANVLQGADAVAYETDWRKRYQGKSLAVVRPANVQEVAAVVKLCAATSTAIVTQGGNTGLVGGATPDSSGTQIILNLSRLRAIREIDRANDTMTVEAGCVLQTVQEAAAKASRLFPLSLAAEGSCTIGGNLATNAGGTQVLRYGNARELCLGLEVVTASGEIWHGLKGLRKDNTGYDLRDLFIGSEGTLGIITAATLKLFPLPAATLTSLVALPSVQSAVDLLTLAKSQFAAGLTGFELISRYCLQLVAQHFPQLKAPLSLEAPYYALLELSDHESESHAQIAFERVMSTALEAGHISDAAIAQSLAQSRQFWQLRESIPLAQAEEGLNIKHDISLPISRIPEFVETVGKQLEAEFPGSQLVNFGHLGDGNLHFNLQAPRGVDHAAFLASHQTRCNDIVHEAVHARGGSISAEHGVGQLKAASLPHYKSEVELNLMRSVKQALDPKHLLNPGKVLV
jgi:FAD/FMN-containing dehydrogenase